MKLARSPIVLPAWLPWAAGLAVAGLGYALLPHPALALGAAGVFAVLAYHRPALGLAATLAVLPTYYFPREFGGLAVSLPETALLLTAGACAARWLRRGDISPRATPLDPWVALFLAAALLSFVPTEYLKLSLRSLRTLVLEPVLFYYLVAAVCPSLRAMRPLVAGSLGAAAVIAALAVLQAVANMNTVQAEGVRRALGLYPSPNQLALYLGYALPLAVALALWSPAGRRWYAALASLVGLALALTFSIGGWLGAGAALLVLAALQGRRALVLTAGAGAAVGAGSLLLAVRLGIERVLSGQTATFRRQIWTAALAMLRDHPLLGIGLDNFLYRYQLQYILPEAWAEPNISHPHNWALQFWLDLGILGLVAFLGLLARFGWLALRGLQQARGGLDRALLAGALASVAGLLVHGALDNSYFLVDLAILFWWQMAIAAAAARFSE
ncbi:MAG TPA: O-antigen ligase family protein [Chloroflexota bacterium]|nr:O-antigen ligase family protein [Chloroflexota bacterium]